MKKTSRSLRKTSTVNMGKSLYGYDGGKITVSRQTELEDSLTNYIDTLNSISRTGVSGVLAQSDSFEDVTASNLQTDDLRSSTIASDTMATNDLTATQGQLGDIFIENNTISAPASDMIVSVGTGYKINIEGDLNVTGDFTRLRTVNTDIVDPVIARSPVVPPALLST